MMKKSMPYTTTARRRSARNGLPGRVPVLFCAVALSSTLALSTGLSYAEDNPSHAAAPEQRTYYVQDIKAAVTKHIENAVNAKGIFHMHDDKTGEQLKLKFVQVHDPVRQ